MTYSEQPSPSAEQFKVVAAAASAASAALRSLGVALSMLKLQSSEKLLEELRTMRESPLWVWLDDFYEDY